MCTTWRRISRPHPPAAGEGRGAAAAGADQIERGHLGVAGDDAHAFEWELETVGGELREGGVVPLPVGDLTGEHGQRAVGLEPRGGALRGARGSTDAERGGVVGRARRRLEERGEAEAAVAADRAIARLGSAELVDVGQRERAFHRLACGDVGEGRPGRHVGGKLGDVQEVAATHDLGSQREIGGDEVEHALAHEGFRLPGAAVRNVRRLVGGHHLHVELEVGEPVRAREQHPYEGREDRGRQGGDLIRALVEHHRDAHGANGAVGVVGGLHIEAFLARLSRCLQVLDPVLDPLDRLAQPNAGRAQRDVFPADVGLLPERPTDVGAAHVEPVHRHAEQPGDVEPQRVRVLVGGGVHELTGVR